MLLDPRYLYSELLDVLGNFTVDELPAALAQHMGTVLKSISRLECYTTGNVDRDGVSLTLNLLTAAHSGCFTCLYVRIDRWSIVLLATYLSYHTIHLPACNQIDPIVLLSISLSLSTRALLYTLCVRIFAGSTLRVLLFASTNLANFR